MARIEIVASDHARGERRSVAEELQFARGLAAMADAILSDLQASTHELTLCTALAAASQAHSSLAAAYMLEPQARIWEMRSMPLGSVVDAAAGSNGQSVPGDGAVSEPLRVEEPGEPNGAKPAEQVAPALAAPRKPVPAKTGGRGRR